MAQGASRHLDAGDAGAGHVPAQPAAVAAEILEPLEREETPLGEHGVERGRRVPLAQDEVVAQRPVRAPRVDAQHARVEHAQQISD